LKLNEERGREVSENEIDKDELIFNLHDDSWDFVIEGLELLLANRKEYLADDDDEVLLIDSLIGDIQSIGLETTRGKIKALRLKETEVSTLEIRQVSQGEATSSDEKQSGNSGTGV
jgi:hypothetical protein